MTGLRLCAGLTGKHAAATAAAPRPPGSASRRQPLSARRDGLSGTSLSGKPVLRLSLSPTYSTLRFNGAPPVPLKIKEREPASGEETGETRTLFRAVPVFDRGQVTAGEHATPLEPPVEPLSGDSHEHLLQPLERFAGSLGFAVSFETIDGPTGGWCDAKRKRIVVDADQPANARVRVLIHEIAYAMGVDYQQYSRAQAEVIVDTVSFVVGSSVHLDLGGETIPYVAGWGESGALEAVTEFAATIDRMARQIEQALDTDQSPASAERAPLPAMSPGRHGGRPVRA
jgi:hypothetical protein